MTLGIATLTNHMVPSLNSPISIHEPDDQEKAINIKNRNDDTNHHYSESIDTNTIRHDYNSRSAIKPDQITENQITESQYDNLTLLIKIIRHGSYVEFIELLEGKGLENLLNVFVDGHTALHYCLIYGRSLAWCKKLVSNGANPNLTNRAGWHPVHLAAYKGSRETMRYLIDCISEL